MPFDFNPRTPVGCDNPTGLHQPLRSDLNPRTPVGCDAQWSFGRRLQMLFQSTHPSGVRRAPITKVRQARYFNPRTPVGCDLPTAPPLFDANNFNPRTPVGCDSYRHHHNKRFHPFQSTHPSGVRPYALRLRFVSRDFNPRTPVGCDRCQQRRCVGYGISIHAPQWGATVDIDVLLLDHLISIHAPQWGATRIRR